MSLIKTEVEGLYRDTSTNAIVNRDTSALKAYKKRKESARRVDEIDNRCEKIERELTEIKSMMGEIIEKLG